METKRRNGALVWYSQSPQTAWRIHEGVEISGTIWPSIKMGTDGTISQLTHCRPPRKGQHPCLSLSTLLVAWDDHMGGAICSRMCTLPTEQNMYHKKENPSLSHPRRPIDVPIQRCCPRPHHPTAQSQQIWRNPHCSRPGMFQSCYLPPMPHGNHWRGSSPFIPQTPIPVVRSPFKNNIQLRSSIHVPLCTSINYQAKHRMKH